MMHLPDWRDASNYPNEMSFKEEDLLIDDPLHTSKAWAWQFLRRNPQFVMDSDAAFLSGSQNEKSKVAMQYGLSFLLNYKTVFPTVVPFSNTFALRTLSKTHHSKQVSDLQPYEIGLVFDLRFPIATQLNLAKAQYEEEKRKLNDSATLLIDPSRKRPIVFQRYLRVLDGRSQGASNHEIASCMIDEGLYIVRLDEGQNGDEQAAQDHHRAKQLILHGYRHLAYS